MGDCHSKSRTLGSYILVRQEKVEKPGSEDPKTDARS